MERNVLILPCPCGTDVTRLGCGDDANGTPACGPTTARVVATVIVRTGQVTNRAGRVDPVHDCGNQVCR